MHIAFYVLPLSFFAQEVHSNISVVQNYRDRSSLVNLTIFLNVIRPNATLDSLFAENNGTYRMPNRSTEYEDETPFSVDKIIIISLKY